MFDALFDAAWAQTLTAWLATYALHSTLLLGAAWLASRWITGALAQDALWKTAVVAGLVTTSVQMTVQPSVYASSTVSESTLVVLRGEDVSQLIELSADRIIVQERGEAAPLVIERSLRPGLLNEATAATTGWAPVGFRTSWSLPETASRWIAVLVGFWLLGFAVEGLRRVRTHRRFVDSLGDRVPVERAHLLAEVERLGIRVGLRYPLHLTQSRTLAVPVALGVDEVVLPTWAVEDTAPIEQRALLAHEVAHLARRDPFWLAVFALVESVFFFQPLNHLARRRQQAAAERLCDGWAAEQTSPLAMARCLVDAAGRLRAHRLDGASAALPHLVPGMAAGRGGALSDRVEHLIDGAEPGASRRWPLAVAACCVIGLVACAGPAVTGTSPTTAATLEAPTRPSPPASPTVSAVVVASAPPAVTALVAPPPVALSPVTRAPVALSPVTRAPVVPVPGAPAPPPAAATTIAGPDTVVTFSYTRNDDRTRLRVERKGTVTFTQRGVMLSEGGRLLVHEELPSVERRYEARTDAAGGLVEAYEVDGTVQALDAAGLRWLQDRYEQAAGASPPPPPPAPSSSLPPPPPPPPSDGERIGMAATAPTSVSVRRGAARERDLTVLQARIETVAAQHAEALHEAHRRVQERYAQQREAAQAQTTSAEEVARAIEELRAEYDAETLSLDLTELSLSEDLEVLAEQFYQLADTQGVEGYQQVRDQLGASLAQLERLADAPRDIDERRPSVDLLQRRAAEFEREAERLREAAERLRLEAEDRHPEDNGRGAGQ
ncbi:MAG: M56 family metallopeptidase [Bacteroidota bacterium]